MTAVVLTDETVLSLVTAADLPCAERVVTRTVTKRGCCGRHATRETVVVSGSPEAFRICVYQMAPERLAAFKKAVGVDSVIIYLKTPGFPKRAVR